MICWFLLVPARVPVLVSLLLSSFLPQERGFVSSWISWFLLVLAGVPVLVSLLLSSFFSQEKGSVPSWISWFLLLRSGVPVLVSLLLPSFLRKGVLFHHDLLVPLGSSWGSGACLPSSLFLDCLVFVTVEVMKE